ncbi:hypothetical protein D1871_07990 [Nakamurella silvestris]|nr:hypothetical protein D1871_07990 [Nakamurella silvestris]
MGYLDRIGELIKAKGLTGYVDAALHVPERSVTISWKGTPPAELTPLVAEAASQGITITFVAAPYSDAELQSALEEISGPLADMANLRLEGHAIDMIGLAEGHTGLAIAGPLASTNPETQAQIRAIAREAIGDIPIFFVAQPPKMDTDDLKSGNGS